MSIYDYLERYAKSRFHTPGHKGRLNALDITEIPDEFPLNLISEAEKKTAELYGADNIRYLVGGSSVGMKAALLAVGGDIVSEHYRHACVDEGAALASVSVHTISKTTLTGGDGLPLLPTADDVKDALKISSAAAAVIQYPDYYGRCVDIKSIYAAVRSLGKLLIVDSAHGAHFAFRPDLFPVSATLASDACNLSAHKTLSAYTQTAYLAFGVKMSNLGVDDALKNLGTTSPNYVFLAQLEKAADDAAAGKSDYDRLKIASDRIRAHMRTLDNGDFTRLVVDCRACGGGKSVYRALYENGVSAEKYDENYVVFILTPADTDEDLENLLGTLKRLTGNGK